MSLPAPNYRRQAISLAIALGLVLAATGINWLLSQYSDSLWQMNEGICIAFLWSQLTISAVWLVFGRAWFLIRMCPPPLLMQGMWTMFDNRMPIAVMAMFFAMVVAGLMAYAILTAYQSRGRQTDSSSEPDRQFSIRELLGATTCVAILFAFANLHRDHIGDGLYGNFFHISVVCLCFAATALSGAWAVLSPSNRLLWRILPLPLAVAATVWFFFIFVGSRHTATSWIVTTFFMQELFVVVELLVYRLTVRHCFRPKEVEITELREQDRA